MTSIFLSHSHADREFARKLASDLRLSGIHVWSDEAEIKVGESLLSKIQSGIMEMNYLAVILSPNSVTSNWVTLELQMAMSLEIDNRKVKVLPILFQSCELPLFLRDKKYVDFTDIRKYRAALDVILDTLLERPAALHLTAKDAARLVKVNSHPKGVLCGVSQQGISQQYIMHQALGEGYFPDWSFADAKTGRSRIWILDYYDETTSTLNPYGVLDGEITDFYSATSLNKPKVIDFNFIDSDAAVFAALNKARELSAIPSDDSQFFINTRMTYFADIGHFQWLIMFFDITLTNPTYWVGINARNGDIEFAERIRQE